MSPRRFNLHRRMPLEVRLEIFGFLPFKAWYRLCLHNRRTKRVLLGNLRYLAPLPRLDYIRCSYHNEEDEAVDITNSYPALQESPAEDLAATLQTVQDQGIPLATETMDEEDENDILYLNIMPEHQGSKVSKKWVIRLPVQPTTVGELRLIQVWLRAISRTHFHHFELDAFFNPAFLQLLFPRSSGPVFRFHADTTTWYPHDAKVQTQIELAPRICARHILRFRFAMAGDTPEAVVQLACSLGSVPAEFDCDMYKLDKVQQIVQACHSLPRPLLDRFPGRLTGLLLLPNPQLAIELPDSKVVAEMSNEQTKTFETSPTKADPKRRFRIELKTTDHRHYVDFKIRCVPIIVADET